MSIQNAALRSPGDLPAPRSLARIEEHDAVRLVDSRTGARSEPFEWIQELEGSFHGKPVVIHVVPIAGGRAQLLFDAETAEFKTGLRLSNIRYRPDLERFEAVYGLTVALLDHRTGYPVENRWFQDLEKDRSGAIMGVQCNSHEVIRDLDATQVADLSEFTLPQRRYVPRMIGATRVIREDRQEYVAGPNDTPVSEKFDRITANEGTVRGTRREFLFGWRGGEAALLVRGEEGVWRTGESWFSSIRVRGGTVEATIGDAWTFVDPDTGLGHEMPDDGTNRTGGVRLLPPHLVFEEREVLGEKVLKAGVLEWFVDARRVPIGDQFEAIEITKIGGLSRPVGVSEGKRYLLGIGSRGERYYSKPGKGFDEIYHDEELGCAIGRNGEDRFVLSEAAGEPLHAKPFLAATKGEGSSLELRVPKDPPAIYWLPNLAARPKDVPQTIDLARELPLRQTRSTPGAVIEVLAGLRAKLGELRLGGVACQTPDQFLESFRGGELRGLVVEYPGKKKLGWLLAVDAAGMLRVFGAHRRSGLTLLEAPYADIYFDSAIGTLVGRSDTTTPVRSTLIIEDANSRPGYSTDVHTAREFLPQNSRVWATSGPASEAFDTYRSTWSGGLFSNDLVQCLE